MSTYATIGQLRGMGVLGQAAETWIKVETVNGTIVEGWDGDESTWDKIMAGGGVKTTLLSEQRDRAAEPTTAARAMSFLTNLLSFGTQAGLIPGAPAVGGATVTDPSVANAQYLEALEAEKRKRTALMVGGSIAAVLVGGVLFLLLKKK